MNITDMLLVTAMGPPGGGRTFITSRILRHMSLVSIAEVIFIFILLYYNNCCLIYNQNKFFIKTSDMFFL